jgi:hypothetical protein
MKKAVDLIKGDTKNEEISLRLDDGFSADSWLGDGRIG